jgi:dethiobiotin synthetase
VTGEVWSGPVVVTGTDTGVGKTVVTAAIAAAAARAGVRVAVVKPAQTGDDSDVDSVRALAAPPVAVALASYPDPLAPLAAARVAGLPPLRLKDVVDSIAGVPGDLVLVEGAGGLLVSLGDGWTIADLAAALGAPAVVVARAGLGTLNHTALTLEALARRGIDARVVIGAWPVQPELVHLANLTDLAGDLAGAVPENAGVRADFRDAAPDWLGPGLYGRFDAGAFRAQGR